MNALRRTELLASVVLILVVVLLIGLLGRVLLLERRATSDDIRRLRSQHTAAISTMAPRGPVFSGDGTLLATSERMYNLFADPGFITKADINKLKPEQIEATKKILYDALAPLVQRPAEDLKWQIEQNAAYESGRPRRFLWLAREVDEDFHNRFYKVKADLRDKAKQAAKSRDGERAKLLAHALDGVGFVRSIKRVYPMGKLAGHVIGTTNVDGGIDAMEFQLEHLLKGRPGRVLVTKDAARHTLQVQDEQYRPADYGRKVWLTIDTVIQGIAEEELEKTCRDYNAESGCAILMDPHTGKILAMASWPQFSPGNPREGRPEDRRNRNLTDPYEPGSIFKPFVMAWALEKGIVTPTQMVNCGGGVWHDPTGRAVKDVHGVGFVNWSMVLIKSSNIGMAQLGWKMGIPHLHDAVRNFGFGQRTGIELPGDQKGLVKPLGQWNKGTLTSASFGYEIAATPLQLVRAYAAFGNEGWLVTPRIIHAAEDDAGKVTPWQDLAGPATEKQIISKKTAETMRDIMEQVYIKGTAKGKGSKVYRLFGKTGTAHVAVRGAAHYAGDQYNSSFLCGGPVTSPRVVAVMAIHKPDRSKGHFGGTVAAPGATRMVERALMYMQVTPDQPDAAALVAGRN